MLYTEQAVRDNVRSLDGKRVFCLGEGDRLTAAAEDWLREENIETVRELPKTFRLRNGAVLQEKPERMTHLRGNLLVDKTDPVIAFRGEMDSLESEILLAQLDCGETLRQDLQEILDLARKILRCEVLEEPLKEEKLCGLTWEEQRERSHFPQKYYGQPHFMPSAEDGRTVLTLNRLRCAVRRTERAAAAAFRDRDGTSLLRALNRMSSMVWILMIREKGRHP